MNVKELERVYWMNKHIQDRVDRLDNLRCSVGNSAVRYDGDPVQSSNGQDRLERMIAEIVDLENEIDEMVDRYARLKKRVIGHIDRLPNERSRDVMYNRYILFMSFGEISKDLNVDKRWIKRVHERALKEYKEIELKSTQSTKCCSNY